MVLKVATSARLVLHNILLHLTRFNLLMLNIVCVVIAMCVCVCFPEKRIATCNVLGIGEPTHKG